MQPQRKIKLHVGIVGENETHLSLNSVKIAENDNEVKSAYHPSGVSVRLSSSRFLLHEATSSIYFYSPVDGMLVHRRVTPSITLIGTNLYTWLKRGTVSSSKVSCPRTQHSVPGQGLKPDRSIRSRAH